MPTVHALAPAEMLLAGQPPRHTRLRIFGSIDHPAAGALRDVPAEPATATLVLLGARFAPADNAPLLASMRNARWHRRRLLPIHLGPGAEPWCGPPWPAVEFPTGCQLNCLRFHRPRCLPHCDSPAVKARASTPSL
jgi:hypothetical protein